MNSNAGKMSTKAADKGIRELERAERGLKGEKKREEQRIPKVYSELVLPHETGSSGREMHQGTDFSMCVC